MNIFNFVPIMLYRTAVLGVGAAGILLPVLGCTWRKTDEIALEKGAFLIVGTIVVTIIYYQNGFFDTNFQKQYYQAINTDVTECQHCHRSFEGMEYIGDKCPYLRQGNRSQSW